MVSVPKGEKSNDLENVQTPEFRLKCKEELLKENKKLSKLSTNEIRTVKEVFTIF